MNYGYAGTRELNEALRLAALQSSTCRPSVRKPQKAPEARVPHTPGRVGRQFRLSLRTSAEVRQRGDIHRALDLRGLMSSVRLDATAASRRARALRLGVVNKAFDPFERRLGGRHHGAHPSASSAGPSL